MSTAVAPVKSSKFPGADEETAPKSKPMQFLNDVNFFVKSKILV